MDSLSRVSWSEAIFERTTNMWIINYRALPPFEKLKLTVIDRMELTRPEVYSSTRDLFTIEITIYSGVANKFSENFVIFQEFMFKIPGN